MREEWGEMVIKKLKRLKNKQYRALKIVSVVGHQKATIFKYSHW